MPKGVDEKIWNKAVDVFEKSYGHKPKQDKDYAIVSSIYQKMGGDFDIKELQEDLSMDSPFVGTKMLKKKSEVVTPAKEEDVDEEELKKGIEVELEHTNDREEAKKIALQHLAEVSDYYTKLKKYVEPKMERLNKLYEDVCKEGITTVPDAKQAWDKVDEAINGIFKYHLKSETRLDFERLYNDFKRKAWKFVDIAIKESVVCKEGLTDFAKVESDYRKLKQRIRKLTDEYKQDGAKVYPAMFDRAFADIDNEFKKFDMYLGRKYKKGNKESLSRVDGLHESVVCKEGMQVNNADNDVLSGMIKLRKALKAEKPEALNEFSTIKRKYEDEMSNLYKKYDL